MHTEYLDYLDEDVTCEAFIAYEESNQKKRPCVLVNHAWHGQSDFERGKAEELAKLGYVGIAVDNYGKGKRNEAGGDSSHLMMPLLNDRATLRRRLLAGLAFAAKHPLVDNTHIAAMGYCFGGLCVLDLARSAAAVQGVVSFHGIFNPPNLGPQEKISSKILILHGYDDPMATPDAMLGVANELTEAGADWQIYAYGHTLHGFANPKANMPEKGIVYNAATARRAWTATTDFFTEVFA